VGSVTKPYTCAAVMQQYERGKLDIDAPIARCFPEPNKHQPSQPRVCPALHICTGSSTAHSHFGPPTPTSGRPLPLRAAPVGPWTANPSAPDLCTFAFLTAPCRYPRAPGAGGSGADS
jgi:CubicO group peptidase (beta-lactamase class C family)